MENVYAALLLHKAGKDVNEDNLKKVIVAAGVEVSADVETQVKSLVASLKGVDIDSELANASLAVSSGAVSSSGTAEPSKAEKKEEKPKEKEKAPAAEGLSALFG
jgi:large subunit ribosomal protein L12